MMFITACGLILICILLQSGSCTERVDSMHQSNVFEGTEIIIDFTRKSKNVDVHCRSNDHPCESFSNPIQHSACVMDIYGLSHSCMFEMSQSYFVTGYTLYILDNDFKLDVYVVPNNEVADLIRSTKRLSILSAIALPIAIVGCVLLSFIGVFIIGHIEKSEKSSPKKYVESDDELSDSDEENNNWTEDDDRKIETSKVHVPMDVLSTQHSNDVSSYDYQLYTNAAMPAFTDTVSTVFPTNV